jgi:hypothetical protein
MSTINAPTGGSSSDLATATSYLSAMAPIANSLGGHQVGVVFSDLALAAQAVRQVGEAVSALRTLGTVQAAAAGTGCPETSAAIEGLGAEVVAFLGELALQLYTEAERFESSLSAYGSSDSQVAAGMNSTAAQLGTTAPSPSLSSTTTPASAPVAGSPVQVKLPPAPAITAGTWQIAKMAGAAGQAEANLMNGVAGAAGVGSQAAQLDAEMARNSAHEVATLARAVQAVPVVGNVAQGVSTLYTWATDAEQAVDHAVSSGLDQVSAAAGQAGAAGQNLANRVNVLAPYANAEINGRNSLPNAPAHGGGK